MDSCRRSCRASGRRPSLVGHSVRRDVPAGVSWWPLHVLSELSRSWLSYFRGGTGEEDLPAQQSSSCKEARLPSAHEHPRRPSHSQGSSRPRPGSAVGLIHRIRDRAGFELLRQRGRRVSSGPLWCIAVIDEDATHPQVAYAFGRAFGPAVVRNRMRRRLRALLATQPGLLRPGWYLFGARPEVVDTTHQELSAMLAQLHQRMMSPSRASKVRS